MTKFALDRGSHKKLICSLQPWSQMSDNHDDEDYEPIFDPSGDLAGEPRPNDPGDRRGRPYRPVRLGTGDIDPLHLDDDDDGLEEGGMLMGPDHPVFRPPDSHTNLPPPGHPPGARFDPVSPLRPIGEPDNDEFPPPGPPGDDTVHGVRGPSGQTRRRGSGTQPSSRPLAMPHFKPPGGGSPGTGQGPFYR